MNVLDFLPSNTQHYLLGYPCDVEECTEVMKTWTLLIKHKHLHHTKGKVLVMEQNIVELS